MYSIEQPSEYIIEHRERTIGVHTPISPNILHSTLQMLWYKINHTLMRCVCVLFLLGGGNLRKTAEKLFGVWDSYTQNPPPILLTVYPLGPPCGITLGVGCAYAISITSACCRTLCPDMNYSIIYSYLRLSKIIQSLRSGKSGRVSRGLEKVSKVRKAC